MAARTLRGCGSFGQVAEPLAIPTSKSNSSADGTAAAGISKGGSLGAQETKVFQAAVVPNKAFKATIVKKTQRRRGTEKDYADLMLMMNAGAASDMDDFKLTSRSMGGDSDPQLEMGNCGSGPSKPLFIGVKNDGWYGGADYEVQMTMVECTNCTGVRCAPNMECVEATGGYELCTVPCRPPLKPPHRAGLLPRTTYVGCARAVLVSFPQDDVFVSGTGHRCECSRGYARVARKCVKITDALLDETVRPPKHVCRSLAMASRVTVVIGTASCWQVEAVFSPGDNFFRVLVPAGRTLIASAYPSLEKDAFVSKM